MSLGFYNPAFAGQTITGSNGSVSVYGSLGSDSVSASASKLSVDVTEGDDFVTVTGGNAAVWLGTGNDTLVYTAAGGAGTITAVGGSGDDTISIDDVVGSVTISDLPFGPVVGTSNDVISIGQVTGGKLSINDTLGSSVISVAAANGTITTGTATDSISVGGGAMTIRGGGGGDFLTVSGGVHQIELVNSGMVTTPHTLQMTGGTVTAKMILAASLDATISDGTLIATGGKSVTISGAGADQISYSLGDSSTVLSIIAGTGNDTVSTFALQSFLALGDGANSVTLNSAMNGSHTVYTGAGVDTVWISGAGGQAVVKSGDGNDVLTLSNATLTVEAGDGNDVVSVSSATGATLSLDGGNDTLAGSVTNATVYGGAGADSVSMTAFGTSNSFVLGDGDDYVSVSGGLNSSGFIGLGDGDNVAILRFLTSANVLTGSGSNTITVIGRTDLAAAFGDGANALSFDNGKLVVYGGAGNDTVTATSVASGSWIGMGGGDDRLTLGTGNVAVSLGSGNDSVVAGGGNQEIYGEDGNDTLDGGSGSDFLQGGAGADVFVFRNYTVSGGQADVIADFEVGVDAIHVPAAAVGTVTNAVSAAGLVYTFANGNTITLQGIASSTGVVIDYILV